MAAVRNVDVLAQRLRTAFDLSQLGIDIMRQNLVRRHPGATEEEIDAQMVAWLRRRPPDSPGTPRTSPA